VSAPRDDTMRLRDIVRAAEKLAILVSKGRAAFDEDWMIGDLAVHELEIIGEAAWALPVEFRDAHPDIEWRKAIAMRNRLIHGYADIDQDMVWVTALNHIPPLLEQVTSILTDMEGSTR